MNWAKLLYYLALPGIGWAFLQGDLTSVVVLLLLTLPYTWQYYNREPEPEPASN